MRKNFNPIPIGSNETREIVLDNFVLRNSNLVFKGQADAKECTLIMKDVSVINAITIEKYQEMELDFQAPFIEVADAEGVSEEGRTFIVVAKDWAYTVVCKDYELEV